MPHSAYFGVRVLMARGKRLWAAGVRKCDGRKARLKRECEHNESEGQDRNSMRSGPEPELECAQHSLLNGQFLCRSIGACETNGLDRSRRRELRFYG